MADATPQPQNNSTMIIVLVGVMLMCVLSSMFGLFGYFQGWFSFAPAQTLYTTAPATTTDTMAPETAAPGTFAFTGVSTACATSYKQSLDQFNTALPPFDPNKCQGMELESNCNTWQSMPQGTGYVWKKTGSLDGCVPVTPDVVGVAKGSKYVTDAGEVQLDDGKGGRGGDGSTNINQDSGMDVAEPGAGGGYGKYGNWRNARDSRDIVAMARSGRLRRKGGRVTVNSAKAGRVVLKKPTTTTTTTTGRKYAKGAPAPYESPAYSENAPYQTGMIEYSAI